MTNYGLDDGDGNCITTGLPEHTARATAQRMANERGKTLYLYAIDEGGEEPAEFEEFVPTYTYTIFDSHPAASSGANWPSHTDVEIEAGSNEEALSDVRDVLDRRAVGLSAADGYAVGDTLYAIVWDAAGTDIGMVTYVLTDGDVDEPVTPPAKACECPSNCGCTEDATTKDDGGNDVCASCEDYATGEDGTTYCSRCPEYADKGEWTGGGSGGTPTGWVSRPVVRCQQPDADDMIARVVALVGHEPREDGTTGQIVRQALADDPTATAEDIAAIIREARDDAKAERAAGY